MKSTSLVLASLFLAAAATAALAQQPQQPYTVTLTPDHMQTVIDGLSELPLKRSEAVKGEIIRQIIAENERRVAASKQGPAEPEKK